MTKDAVKKRLIFRLTRACSLVAVAAWLLATNHCAVGNFAADDAPASEHASCHAQEAPGEEEEGGACADLSCCDALSAPLAAAKILADHDASLFTTQQYLLNACAGFGAAHDAPSVEWDTGPPGGHSFAESVLQRSLLAHAPPVFA